ncbi:hypothetical protein LWI28_028699 [Acer negundo]|uniref:Uncharacterized protein n=1 Tax=Acer negundo TaxID=4023 RepID=A0AAD5J8I1_ACENE|nr:hypothetical protein LWI28_028699 [Acer negundo]
MKIDVEVISREIIKPTTSPHDQYKFSLLDQVNPTWYLPFIYFYSVDHKLISKNEISKHLKTSLSQVLNHYYLLAGIVNDNFVDCKNGGVLVLEAQVNCHLSEFLQNPNPDNFVNKFLPNDANKLFLTVQLNFFNCGSIAIGVRMSHKVTDAFHQQTCRMANLNMLTGKGSTKIHSKEKRFFSPVQVFAGFVSMKLILVGESL